MSRCLLLLTSAFPFANGEPFLENEIFFHEDHFDKIIILAMELSPDSQMTRPIPANAEAYNVARKSKSVSRAIDVCEGGLRLLHPSPLTPADRAQIGASPLKRLFSEYFERRSRRQFEECLPILQKTDFTVFDEVVVYSYWFFANCKTGIYLTEWLREQGIPASLYSRAHGYDLYEYVNALQYLPYRHEMAAACETVFACSEDGCAHLRRTVPSYADHFQCSYLGTFDHGLNRYDDAFHIVTCSRTTSIKRLDKLVDALSLLKSAGAPPIHWTHIGDGDQQSKSVAAAHQLYPYVRAEFPGSMENADVIRYYQSHPVTVTVNVSSNEGLPVSIMEAISFGIPVIATNVGGTSEIVHDGYNGFLLEKDFDHQVFIDRLLALAQMPQAEYEMLRQNARAFWETHFNAADNYPAFSAKLGRIRVPAPNKESVTVS